MSDERRTKTGDQLYEVKRLHIGFKEESDVSTAGQASRILRAEYRVLPGNGTGYLPGLYGTWSRMMAKTTWQSFLATAVTATRWGLPSERFLS